jgi:hypothetical protein
MHSRSNRNARFAVEGLAALSLLLACGSAVAQIAISVPTTRRA